MHTSDSPCQVRNEHCQMAFARLALLGIGVTQPQITYIGSDSVPQLAKVCEQAPYLRSCCSKPTKKRHFSSNIGTVEVFTARQRLGHELNFHSWLSACRYKLSLKRVTEMIFRTKTTKKPKNLKPPAHIQKVQYPTDKIF